MSRVGGSGAVYSNLSPRDHADAEVGEFMLCRHGHVFLPLYYTHRESTCSFELWIPNSRLRVLEQVCVTIVAAPPNPPPPLPSSSAQFSFGARWLCHGREQ